jgi:hypothetical protein
MTIIDMKMDHIMGLDAYVYECTLYTENGHVSAMGETPKQARERAEKELSKKLVTA